MKFTATYLRILCLLPVLLMSGCATNTVALPNWFVAPASEAQQPLETPKTREQMLAEQGIYYMPDSREGATLMEPQGPSLWLTPKQLYKPDFTHKSLSDYTEQLTMKLMNNGRMLSSSSLIGVASFVRLDSTLNQTNVLGNQLAELFINEVQEYGISVVDFKTTGNISVRADGDFVFSRDARKLADDLSVEYVLSGTLIRNEKGVKVNARIVSMNNRVVVSTASQFIPHFVIEELNPKYVMM